MSETGAKCQYTICISLQRNQGFNPEKGKLGKQTDSDIIPGN